MSSCLSIGLKLLRRQRALRRNNLIAFIAAFLFILYFVRNYNRYSFLDSANIIDIASIRNQTNQKCIHPSLTLWNPEILAEFSKRPSSLGCETGENDWFDTTNGYFHISEKAVKIHGSIGCEYRAILRGSDDFSILSGDTHKISDGDRLPTDFLELTCTSADGKSYKNIHSGVAFNETVSARSDANTVKDGSGSSLGLNIIIMGFDSVSRMAWQRSLPKSHSYFTKNLGGVVLEGYNIVGDGTTQALLPILTGKTESELPESRRGFDGASNVDVFPWIWNDLVDAGYITQYGEDQPDFGSFTYRLLGFKDQPVDHYMRPFHLAAKNHRQSLYCLKGSNPEYLVMMNWLREFVDVYRTQRKFSFVFDCELTHDSGKYLSLADDDLLNLMKHLNDSGHLENTLFMTMSDHGARFTELRESTQGRLEERNPYIGIRLPPGFIRSHPEAYNNLRTNVHRLSTPFDLHSTLRDVISFTGTGQGSLTDRGISLFKEIPKERTCKDAGIEAHWCACLAWSPQSLDDPLVIRVAEKIVQTINAITENVRENCQELSLKEIRSAVKYSTGDGVLRFRKSLDIHGREPDLDDDKKAGPDLFLLSLVTVPGDGVFEATATYRIKGDTIDVDAKSFSRINRYGRQPHCIMDRLPHLRQFCYCVHQLR